MSEERFKQIKDSVELQNLVKKQIGVDDELLQEEIELLEAYEKLKGNWNEFEKYLKNEIKRLEETNIYKPLQKMALETNRHILAKFNEIWRL